MKRITESELDDLTKLPDDFPLEEFNNEVVVTINTLMSYYTHNEWAAVKYEFLSTVLQSLATSTHFKMMKPKDQAKTMRQWLDLQYILDLLTDFFSEDVTDNSTALWLHLQSKLLNKKSFKP